MYQLVLRDPAHEDRMDRLFAVDALDQLRHENRYLISRRRSAQHFAGGSIDDIVLHLTLLARSSRTTLAHLRSATAQRLAEQAHYGTTTIGYFVPQAAAKAASEVTRLQRSLSASAR